MELTMSSLIIEVCRVDAVDKHPHADRLCVCQVKGWRTCAQRDQKTGNNQFEPGDKCVYIPPDSILPRELADRLGITKYLTPVSAEDGTLVGLRVRVSRLRGEPSYGLIMEPDDPTWEVGKDVADILGI